MIAETEPIERLAEVISLHWDTPTHLKAGLQSEIYGPYLQAMMNHAVQRVNDGTNNPEATELALLIAADEYFWAER
ncbi:hypothetical protein KKE03_01675, partial [Patescibacteria group bacterium]|nr:hypothetical protein [Patescibacteria group bacterium]